MFKSGTLSFEINGVDVINEERAMWVAHARCCG